MEHRISKMEYRIKKEYIKRLEIVFILNLTQGEFFRYTRDNKEDNGYNKILSGLITPPKKKLLGEEEDDPVSYWAKTDKIVFVPRRLMCHVEKNYGEINRNFEYADV